MPLPQPGIPWPPPQHAPGLERMREHDAWFCGDPDRLTEVYANRLANHPSNRPSQYRGGVTGRLARWWWGEPTPLGEKRTKLHIPVAGDLATGSADLLFSEAPQLTFEDGPTQDRWDELADQLGLHALLCESAEVQAALGGVYLRVGWDTALADHPLLSVVHADRALPEWRMGMLRAVTLWTVLGSDGNTVIRHVERHELDPNGNGIVLHQVYEGTEANLGKPIGTKAHPETADMPEIVDPNVPGLLIDYVPNMRPNRADRGSQLGRSDYDGAEPLMDALDEVYTSWQRDIRLAKARLLMPSAYMTSLGPGKGSAADLDREIYQQLDIPPTSDAAGITLAQFAIRVDEHQATAQDYMRRIVESAGYSAQTFGLAGADGGDVTATEIHARERRSFTTRGKKANYWTYALRRLAPALLAVDAAIFENKSVPSVPDIEWPDSVSEQLLVLAQSAQALRAAEAASTETLVRIVHPDWDDEQVTEEVRLIDEASALTDPITLQGPGKQQPGTQEPGQSAEDDQGTE